MAASSSLPRVIVGMSGGVDSSVAAYLLLKAGYHVEGLFMKNWEADDDDEYCTSKIDLQDALSVCEKLDIKLHQINFAKTYWDRVFQHFLDEYAAGRTPNPDILCNREIKFSAFLHYAKRLGADFIATGHYVRKTQQHDNYQLLQGCDSNKDQSYFLYTLNQEQLKRSLFPVGELTKTQVRDIARNQGFDTHDKKDSTGICFIGERRFKTFLSQYLPAKPGEIKNLDNQLLGRHDGLMYYTIGQRKGIGIGGTQNSRDEPWYVVKKDLNTNVLYVTQGHNHPSLFLQQLNVIDSHWICGKAPTLPYHCSAKIRYRQQQAHCIIVSANQNEYHVTFNEPQRAVTPGQSIVFYDDTICLGGGIIQ